MRFLKASKYGQLWYTLHSPRQIIFFTGDVGNGSNRDQEQLHEKKRMSAYRILSDFQTFKSTSTSVA